MLVKEQEQNECIGHFYKRMKFRNQVQLCLASLAFKVQIMPRLSR